MLAILKKCVFVVESFHQTVFDNRKKSLKVESTEIPLLPIVQYPKLPKRFFNWEIFQPQVAL